MHAKKCIIVVILVVFFTTTATLDQKSKVAPLMGRVETRQSDEELKKTETISTLLLDRSKRGLCDNCSKCYTRGCNYCYCGNCFSCP